MTAWLVSMPRRATFDPEKFRRIGHETVVL